MLLSRYVDILAAFHAPSLIPGRCDLANLSLDSEERARFRMRGEVRDALCPSNVRVWREELMANSESLCVQLPLAEPIDLSLSSPALPPLCATVTGSARDNAANLPDLAQIASAATVDPGDPILHAHAKDANRTLRAYFDTGPEPLRDSGSLASRSLLRIISAAWFALIHFLRNRVSWAILHDPPTRHSKNSSGIPASSVSFAAGPRTTST
jgi:hypothetical protein